MIKKILVINPFGIGDVLFSTPLLKAIKKNYPDSLISYVCNRRTYDILRNNPDISNMYIFEKDEYRKLWKESKLRCAKAVYAFVRKLQKERYDVVVDMSLNYIYRLFLVGAIPLRIGFNYRKRGAFLNRKLDIEGFDSKHAIEYYLDLGSFLGVDATDKEMRLTIASGDAAWAEKYLSAGGISGSDKVCGIIPGCGASWGKDAVYRRWEPQKFAEIADYINKRYGYKIVIFGEAREQDICDATKASMRADAVETCGKVTLTEFSSLLNRCDLVVTNDGGPLHMAVALKRPTVSIFGPVNEKSYGPYPASDRHVTVTARVDCRPCYRNFRYDRCNTLRCLKELGVDDVRKAVDKLMERI